MDADGARHLLLDGYTRFVTGHAVHFHQSQEWRLEVATTPRPIAVILGCADARVPPEVIFDQGFGDLFVVRVAGAVVTDAVLASIELAVREMGVPLVVVLGHTRCRAIQASVDILSGRAKVVGHEGSLVEELRPALTGMPDGEAAARVVVRLAVERLRTAAPILPAMIASGSVEIAGWLYDVDAGIVEMLA
jgi:carbonic anhydrase